MKRKFVAFWWFVGWELISFGVSIDTKSPNIEIHLPFGFIRFGFEFDHGPVLNPKTLKNGYGIL